MSTVPSELAVETEPKGVLPTGSAPTPARRVIATLRKSPAVVFSVCIIVFIVLLAVFAPVLSAITGWDPYEFDPTAIDSDLGGIPIGPLGGVSAEHWLGVEPGNGRDILVRIAYGARVSLMIALLSALPSGNRPALLVLVLSIFGWPYTARVIRGQTMSLRNSEFVEAARASGARPVKIVFREVLPNLRGTIIVLATLAVPSYIGTEAGLSFLGVGVMPPTPSWGQMIATAVGWYAVDPMFFLVPGTFLFLTVFSFTVLGDNLRRVLDAGDAA